MRRDNEIAMAKIPQFAHVNDVVEWQNARIEALEAALEEALKPFADLYAEILALQKANPDLPQDLDGWALTCKGPDLRHAAALLEKKP